jgi:hypothetical protein
MPDLLDTQALDSLIEGADRMNNDAQALLSENPGDQWCELFAERTHACLTALDDVRDLQNDLDELRPQLPS